MVFTPNTRISAMAKDFGVKSKVITDILLKHGIQGKTHTSVLEPDEFSLVFEVLTRDHQVTNLTQYLAGEADIEREEQAEQQAVAEAKTAVPKDAPAPQTQVSTQKEQTKEEKQTHKEYPRQTTETEKSAEKAAAL